MKRFWVQIGTVVILMSVFVAIICLIPQRERAIAESYTVEECLSSSGAADVRSVRAACKDCVDSTSRAARGALWINGSGTMKNSDVIEVADANASSATIYIWGQVYSCGQKVKKEKSNFANYTWFADAGHDEGNGNNLPYRVDFLSYDIPPLYRGNGQNVIKTWYQPIDNNQPLTLDIDKFKAYVETGKGTKAQEDGPDGPWTYRALVSVNRCFETHTEGYNSAYADCYGQDSEIVLKLGTGTPEPEPAQQGGFTSQSFGQVQDSNWSGTKDMASQIDGTTKNRDSVQLSSIADGTDLAAVQNLLNDFVHNAGFIGYNIKLSDTSTSVDFWHKLYYTPPPINFDDADTVPDVTTAYEIVTRSKRVKVDASSGDLKPEEGWQEIGKTSGDFKVNSAKKPDDSGELPVGRIKTNIALEKGETALVCSTITYHPKVVELGVKDDGDIDGLGGHYSNHIRYDYELKNVEQNENTSGSSESCVLVYRPIEPGGTPWSGSQAGGSPISEIMYAGEATDIGWNVWARGSLFNRITKFEATNYIAPVYKTYNSNILEGEPESKKDPCQYTQPLWSGGPGCVGIPEYSGSAQSIFRDKREDAEKIVTPNEVGSKHGNSAGYFFEVYRYECVAWSNGSCTRHDFVHHPELDYWHVYNTASRSVAKKPSIALWNGGLFTQGGVKTSLATRYTDQKNIIYLPVDQGGDAKQFGSWSEYLAVLGNTTNYFTSGAVLATGLGGNSFNLLENSPLTIANNGSVGGSGIITNNILRDRLQQYFFSKPTRTVSGSLGAEIFDETTIIRADGDLKITGNIKINRNVASTIYDLPQVLIYATGDIIIDGGVNQIDAWLVAGGELKTCDGFDSSKEAKVASASNTACSNNLQINGPVFAKKVVANRTYGADGISLGNIDNDKAGGSDSRAATAEVFNLSAENYLWAYAQAGRYSSSYTETYTRELAPRY